ncbi:MAG: S24 family peptidase [Nitrospinota bacterium]|nr:S24 family peptidase [Nitrospinota bacterium]
MVEFLPLGNWKFDPSNELKFVMKDNSMAPTIVLGEILIVDKSVDSLSKVLVVFHQGKMIARKVRRLEEGGYELVPDNPDYPTFKTEKLQIIGGVVATARGL